MSQETSKRLQEYNNSLQQYSSSLHAENAKNGETISKLQNEKNAVMETLTGLRDHTNSLKIQLDSSRVSYPQFVLALNYELMVTWASNVILGSTCKRLALLDFITTIVNQFYVVLNCC